ncbi:MAG: nicotinamide mononucleotide transporter [Clostridia bacterium]|nr:nicotinamide mononucleotide transporter [Clostridia bacterium]
MKKISKIWMAISVILIIILSIVTDSHVLQIIAAVSGVIYVFSTVFENKYGQLFGVVNSLLYGIIMYSNGVFGTSIYNFVYCIPMQIYTFFTWGQDKTGKNKLEVSRYKDVQRLAIWLVILVAVAAYAIIASKLSVQFALVDGLSIILGIVGLYMASKKKVEQWHMFIVSNIATLMLWIIKCLENITNIPMLLMWIVYFVNNIYGLYTWNKKIRTNGKIYIK